MVIGCASKTDDSNIINLDKSLIKREMLKAEILGKSLVGITTNELVNIYPEIKVIKYGSKRHRYTIRQEFTSMAETAIMMKTVSEITEKFSKITDIDIHLFSDNGIITKYRIEPIRFK